MIITNTAILQYLAELSDNELLLLIDYVQDEMNRREDEKNKVKTKEIAQDILTNTLKQ